MLNPAYMTRQIAESMRASGEVQIHLTSLKPINPNNHADPWETVALRGFERGDEERFALLDDGVATVARYMAPLRTERACLKCHEKQGYKVGDIRGGLSVSFPAAELLVAERSQQRNLIAIHAGAWALLSLLTLLAARQIRRGVLSLTAARDEQEAMVERRTAQLQEQVHQREAAEARLRLLLESSGDGIFGLDREGRITFINPTALRLLGYDRAEELLGRQGHSLWHEACDTCDAERLLTSILRDGAHAHGEDDTFRRADGSPLQVEYRAEPLIIDGSITGAVVSFDDIGERKRKEQELRKLSNAVEHSPESVVITDANGVIEYVNRKFVETTGYTPAEVVGRTPALVKSGKTPPETYRELWSTISSGREWQGTLLNRKRNGELFWEEMSISPITDEQGTITHYVGVKEDITERHRLEEQIWRAANFDALTELPNRRLFRDRLEQTLERARRDRRAFALMFVDLDRFKEVNDTLGHTVGDEVLRESARRLLACVRRSDTVARMGGDEFTVIIPAIDDGDAIVATVAERVREALAQPYQVENRIITISASVGVVFYPRDGDDIEALLRNADVAMYRAKDRGRDAVEFFSAQA